MVGLMLVLEAASARAETQLDERSFIAHCIALREHPKTPARIVRAYCRCMPTVIGGLTRFKNFTALVRTWPSSDAHCRRRAGLK